MSGRRAKAARKEARLSYASLYVAVRGLINHVVSEMEHNQVNIDSMLSFQVPAPDLETNHGKRSRNHKEVTARLKATEDGKSRDWSVRDMVFTEVMGPIRKKRNFWSHSYLVRTDRGLILWMNGPDRDQYPDGIPFDAAVDVGLAFLNDIERYREYLSSQSRNVHEYLAEQFALYRAAESKETPTP